MFSRILLIVSIATLTWKQNCAVYSRSIVEQNNKINRNSLEYVVNKYLGPFRKLTGRKIVCVASLENRHHYPKSFVPPVLSELPNHAIEMQIEILDKEPSLSPAAVPQRRILRATLSPTKKKAGSDNDPPSSVVPMQSDVTTSNTTPEPTSEAMPTSSTYDPDRKVIEVKAAGRSNDTSQLAGTTLDPGKRPVYMEDLNKALSNLEKKLQEKNTSPIANTPCSDSTKISLKQRLTHSGTVRNIGDILQLLKKAVQVEKHMPQPYDENLDWVQIKIPKDVQ